MDKTFWGPSAWCTIHVAAASYKKENRLSFQKFITSLPYLLPCEYCREHLKSNLRTIEITDLSLENNNQLFMWSYFLHDLVNKQLKKRPSPQFQVAKDYYFKNSTEPNFWGPCYWRTIHSFAASYRPEPLVKNAFIQFIYSLRGILPDNESRKRYDIAIQRLPLTESYFKDAHSLFLWSYLFHDIINQQMNKISPGYEIVLNQYFNKNVCDSCGVIKK